MDAQEILDWQVLEKIDPWGQAREDARFAMLASTIANSAGAKKRDGTHFTPKDFMLGDLLEQSIVAEEARIEATPEQHAATMEARFRMAVAANNAFWATKEALTGNQIN